jgi:ketosteroid isomerase-like protein
MYLLSLLLTLNYLKMKKILSLSFLFAFAFLVGCKENKKQSDVKKIEASTLMKESTERFKKYWSLGDANAISNEFTEDAIRVISNSASPIEGNKKIKDAFISTFAEESELKDSQINITISDTRFVSEDILIGAGSFEIIDINKNILESGKWGNVYKFSGSKIKFLLESAHRTITNSEIETKEPALLAQSIVSEEIHFEKIKASVDDYIKFQNEKNAEELSMLFAQSGIQSVSSKKGIIIGRENIKSSEIFSDGQVLNANILGYRYLGNSLAIAYGNWTNIDENSNTMTTGQWGNLFKIEGDAASLLMESAGSL